MADNDLKEYRFAPRCYTEPPPKVERRIFESKRRDHGRVEARRTAPKGTGYRPNPLFDPRRQAGAPQHGGVVLLAPGRTDASVCLDVALGPLGITPVERQLRWARFIMCMMRGRD
jgi:hypothetical protein